MTRFHALTAALLGWSALTAPALAQDDPIVLNRRDRMSQRGRRPIVRSCRRRAQGSSPLSDWAQ